jgi:hypothetical protein
MVGKVEQKVFINKVTNYTLRCYNNVVFVRLVLHDGWLDGQVVWRVFISYRLSGVRFGWTRATCVTSIIRSRDTRTDGRTNGWTAAVAGGGACVLLRLYAVAPCVCVICSVISMNECATERSINRFVVTTIALSTIIIFQLICRIPHHQNNDPARPTMKRVTDRAANGPSMRPLIP